MMVEELTPLRAAELAHSNALLKNMKDRPKLEIEKPEEERDKRELRKQVQALRNMGKTFKEIAKCLSISLSYAHLLSRSSSRRQEPPENDDL